MCLDPATLSLVASGASAGLGVVQHFQANSQARAAQRSADQQAKIDTERAITEQESALEEERYQQGREVVETAARGVSGSFGSPFLVALQNAENSAANRADFGKAAGFQAASTRQAGAQRASGLRQQGFGALVGAGVQGFQAYQGYKQYNQNRVYLGGHSLPGVV